MCLWFISPFQLHNAANANQKEKYESDLKKEIKKLQVRIFCWYQTALFGRRWIKRIIDKIELLFISFVIHLACFTAHGVFAFIGNHEDKRYPCRGSCMRVSCAWRHRTSRHAWFQVSSSIFFHSFFMHALSVSVCIASAAPSWPD